MLKYQYQTIGSKMYKKLIIILILITNLNALECSQEVYIPALNDITKTLNLLDKSSVTPETLKSLQKVKVSKTNYTQDMKKLQNKLSLLQGKKESAIKAKTLNQKNIQVWNALEDSCKGDDLKAVQKVQKDLKDIAKTIDKRLSTIEHYISLTQMGIDIGQKRYAPAK